MTPRETVIAQINHHETERLPYRLSVDVDISDRLDRYYSGQDWRAWLEPYMVMGVAIDQTQARRVDATHYRDAFGALWRDDLRPFHHEEPGLKEPSFDNYEFPTPEQFFDRGGIRKMYEEQRAANPDKFLYGYFGFGLFERTWTIRGFENSLVDAAAEPDFYEELVDRITNLHLEFVRALAELPVDAVFFSDDWGDQRGIILGPERWRKVIKPRLARLYAAVHEKGKYVISHCCGNISEVMPDLIEIGLDVIQSVQPEAMNPYELKRKYGKNITFAGGLGSQSIIPFGTPQELTKEIDRLSTEMGCGGGYILEPAKSLLPETPTENAVAIIEAFKRNYPHG